MIPRSLIWLLVSSAATLAIAGASAIGDARALDPERERTLTNLVRQDCGSCHGMTLKGGLGGPLLPGALQDRDHDDIVAVILDGVPGRPMPPWRGLISEEDARWIAERLKGGFPQ